MSDMRDPEQIDCEEAVRRIAEYLDGELGDRPRAELERHLETCRSCYSRKEFERRLRERMRTDLKLDSVSPEFEERVRSLLGTLSP